MDDGAVPALRTGLATLSGPGAMSGLPNLDRVLPSPELRRRETDPAAVSERPSVSYRTVLKHPNVRILATSRAAQKLGGATLAYASMV